MKYQEAERRAEQLMEADTAIKNMARVASALWGISGQLTNAGSYTKTVERLNQLRVDFRDAFVAAEKQLQEEMAKEMPAIHAAYVSRPPEQPKKNSRKVSR